ncbi:MAG: hypothetical protein Q7J78_02510 [Clostridiales bacterium]|nr:hypothetical protein [Clostridiales bacterium]
MRNTVMSLVLNAPNDLKIEERKVLNCGPNEVLIKIKAASIYHTDKADIPDAKT